MFVTAGVSLEEAKGAMILVHQRGATAQSILQLGNELYRDDFAYIAPQADGYTWYPNSFLAPIPANEPGITNGINMLAGIVEEIESAGIPSEKIVIGGFSQGACLSMEFIARNAKRYGGAFAYSGGLIGPDGTPRNYEGDFNGTPVFLGCSDVDFHIPLARVKETTQVLSKLGATVTEKIYPNMGHTVNTDEIDHVKKILEAV